MHQFEPTRFRLEQVAEGVWAALDIPGRGTGANAGIIDLGDQTLLFDTFQTPQAAAELERAAVALTGRPPSLVINSHFHGDHVHGNQIFAGVPIIATQSTRERMLDWTPRVIANLRERGPGFVAGQEERLAAMAEGPERELFAMEVAQNRELVAAGAIMEPCYPTLLIDQGLVIQGTKRRVELQVLEGHTLSDIIALLPDDRLCFVGDLTLVANHPWMGHGTPEGWPESLDRLEAMEFDRLIPGHGAVGGKERIGEIRTYLEAIQAYAREVAAAGTPAEEAAKLPPIAPYEGWGSRAVFGWNMQFLVDRLTKKEG